MQQIFSINLCEYTILRCNNPLISEIISNAINDPNLLETNVKLKLLIPEITKKEYNQLFDNENKLNYKKIRVTL